LAHPQTSHFSQKLYRYAKGPILEGAVERSETGGVSPGAPERAFYPQKRQENLYFGVSMLINLKNQKTANFFENMC
jgi:hypothetical protein